MAGSYDGVVALATFIGPTGGIREIDAQQNGSGASTESITTSGPGLTSDYVPLFGMNRGTSTDTCNVGSQLKTAQSAGGNGSGSLYSEVPGSNAAITATFGYSSAGSANFQAIVMVGGLVAS